MTLPVMYCGLNYTVCKKLKLKIFLKLLGYIFLHHVTCLTDVIIQRIIVSLYNTSVAAALPSFFINSIRGPKSAHQTTLRMSASPVLQLLQDQLFIFVCLFVILSTVMVYLASVTMRLYFCKIRRLSPQGRRYARDITNRCEEFIQSKLAEVPNHHLGSNLAWLIIYKL